MTGSGKQRTARLLWALAIALFVLLLVKSFVADVYPVRSGSMRPTVFGGADRTGLDELDEVVLVRYERNPELARFDLVVVNPPDGGDPVLKRIVGLPGESVLLSEGDVLIEGRRLPEEVERPAPIPVFDDRVLDVGDNFNFAHERWTREADGWRVDAREIRRDADRGMMFLHKDLDDSYFDHEQRWIHGLRQVNDGILECEVLLEDPLDSPEARLRFQLTEQSDTFQACIESDWAGGFRVQLLRRNPETLQRVDPRERLQLLAEAPIALEPGRWQRVSFRNVDNHLAFELDGRRVVAATYAENVPHPAELRIGQKSFGQRVGFGAERCVARFRSIVVLRDLYFTESGEFATSSYLSLGPAEYFVLGDNSTLSHDSRHFGPVSRSSIVGRPLAVVWPWGRARRLRR